MSRYRYSLVRLDNGHSFVPTCRLAGCRAQGQSMRAPRLRRGRLRSPPKAARSVIDGPEHGGMTAGGSGRRNGGAVTKNTVALPLDRLQPAGGRRAGSAPTGGRACAVGLRPCVGAFRAGYTAAASYPAQRPAAAAGYPGLDALGPTQVADPGSLPSTAPCPVPGPDGTDVRGRGDRRLQ